MERKAKRDREMCRANGSVRDGKRPAPAAGSDDGDGAGNELPMANVVRLMRQAIPTDVKISGRAKRLTHDCAVEFVAFVGGEAAECTAAEHRRTIAPEDFTRAFERLGFDDYVAPLSTYIRRYRENHQNGGIAPPRPSPAASSFTDEEVQFLMSVVPEPLGGYDGAASSSKEAPPPDN